jgi:hypothetical protein
MLEAVAPLKISGGRAALSGETEAPRGLLSTTPTCDFKCLLCAYE